MSPFSNVKTSVRGQSSSVGSSRPIQHDVNPAAHNTAVSELLAQFRSPLTAFRPVPFYWWAGEPLSRERIAWQLDQLKEKGIKQVIVSYPHKPDGSTETGTPPIFSRAWWKLFRWFLSQCRERDMTAGIQDYTLVGPMLQEIGSRTSGMSGGQLGSVSTRAAGPVSVALRAEVSAQAVGAWAYPLREGIAQSDGVEDLTSKVQGGQLSWNASAGNWLVVLVFFRPSGFDPMHPESGRLAIESLYAPFERECPGEVGRTLKVFFQDELDFGSTMPFWSNHLRSAFQASKGYDLWPLLPALWLELGSITVKVRLDYADVVTRQMERCYFEPIFRWHEARGTLFGHDNLGRGEMRRGRAHYGDYFRAMRWYSAPGCDDPKINGERAFKGLKVTSSIAHLYHRPRVWVEAFHSSGWGTTPAEVVAALNEDFACGANVVNLHGLYYTTNGGWWEWAPPDFHFRQPYWQHCESLNDCFTRLSWLLSQGTHRCDVAIVYPSAALEAEAAANGSSGVHSHMGHAAIEDSHLTSADPEWVAFGLGKYLFDRACDFDFIDFESLARAKAEAGELRVSDEVYRVLILPVMTTVRLSTLKAARDFVRAGGLVIACGSLPGATECGGTGDPDFETIRSEIFSAEPNRAGGRGFFVEHSYGEVLRLINEFILRDVTTSAGRLQVLHRRCENQDVYYVVNPSTASIEANVCFRANGAAEHWDAWTAAVTPQPVLEVVDGASRLRLSFAAREARIIVFDRNTRCQLAEGSPPTPETELARLDGFWDFVVQPTLDNRFGDFRLPASPDFIGPEARRFKWAEEFLTHMNWQDAAFDDSLWPESTYSFGPRFEFLGPVAPGAREVGVWQPYEFSLRWGVERDPFLTDWSSGPHGLKGKVPDEFLDFYCPQPGSEWHLRSQLVVEQAREATLRAGGRCAFQVWLNEELVLEQTEALPPGRYPQWNIPHYECTPRETRVKLRAGVNQLRLKLVQPEGQRTRAFVAFDPPAVEENHLGLRWFAHPQTPRPTLLAPAERQAVWLRCVAPAGLQELEFVARGPARVWADGKELKLQQRGMKGDGSFRYHGVVAEVHPQPVTVALRIEAGSEFRAGDVLPEPLQFKCGAGRMPVGDWCQHGLAHYSGIGEYQQTFEVNETARDGRLILDLGEVFATAEVLVNGVSAGMLSAPPWRVDVTKLVEDGANKLTVRVANTLANHYCVGIPTPYAFPHQTRSGLLGPVRLIHEQS